LRIPNNVLYAIFDKIRFSSGNSRFSNCYLLQSLKFKNNAGINGTSLGSCFSSCYNLEKIDGLDCSSITNISATFSHNYKLKSIANLNFGKVTNINNAFTRCTNLTNLGNIDFSEITLSSTDSNLLFQYNTNLEDLSKYTLNEKNISFQNLYRLEKLPQFTEEFIENTGTFLQYCFAVKEINCKLKPKISAIFIYIINECPALKKIKYVDFINVSTSSNFNCFSSCNNLIEIEEIYNINTLLNFNTNTLLNHSTLLRILNALVDLTGQEAKTLTLGTTNLAKLTDEEKAIATNKNWILK